MAGRVFEHFNGLYRFQGLRRYKEKYSPNWEPRFLVYQSIILCGRVCLK